MLTVVAASEATAKATIRWLKLEESKVETVLYGRAVEKPVQHALLVRPVEGLTPHWREWVAAEFVPNVTGQMWTHPGSWNPAEETPEPPAEKIGTELEENPLYA